ncbi:hypothetical protein KR038_009715 [Drosophila bunnanda]|nr:hypothetical protein KR038_009715 [Drosophila bunnanda]
MANRNVPATPSQEELREKVNIKNVKNSEERETDNLNTNADTDSLPTVSSAEAVDREAGGSLKSRTKIPGPTALGPTTSTFQMGIRKYTSILDTTRSPMQSANDSGIQADASISEPDPSTMSPIPTPVPSCRSEMALKLDELETLRELQRVVAEMEAEVALADKEDGKFGLLDATNADQTSLASDVEPVRDPDFLQTSEEKLEPGEELLAASKAQLDPLSQVAELGSAQKLAPDNDATSSHGEDPLAASEAPQEPQTIEPGQVSTQKLDSDGAQINVEKSDREDLLPGTTEDVVVQENSLLKKQTQMEVIEPVKDLLEPIPQVSAEKLPQIALAEPSTCTVEAALQQAFANVNQVQTPLSPEEPVDALNGAGGGQTVPLSQDLLGEPEPEIADIDLITTSEAVLVTQPSSTNSHTGDSVGSDRRMIHLEELLRNANNVDLLRRLLQIGAEANVVESEPDCATQESSAGDKDVEGETESVPETSTTSTCTATGTEASTDEDTELNDNEDDDSTDVVPQVLKAKDSVVWRLLSGKMIHLACPILFCGFAAGLIYMSRKG